MSQKKSAWAIQKWQNAKTFARTLGMTTEELKAKLENHFASAEVQVFDLTGGSNHFEVEISASQFSGLSLIQQHRQVMGVLESELASGEVHALSIKSKAK